jgi:hypothetical protein
MNWAADLDLRLGMRLDERRWTQLETVFCLKCFPRLRVGPPRPRTSESSTRCARAEGTKICPNQAGEPQIIATRSQVTNSNEARSHNMLASLRWSAKKVRPAKPGRRDRLGAKTNMKYEPADSKSSSLQQNETLECPTYRWTTAKGAEWQTAPPSGFALPLHRHQFVVEYPGTRESGYSKKY